MFGNPVGSGLSFTKILTGISKTLNIANQVIPLYKEAKPMLNNAKTVLSVLKGINTPNNSGNTSTKNNQISNNTIKKDTVLKNSNTNNPSFFL